MILISEETNTPFPSVTESDKYQLLHVKAFGVHRAGSIKTHTLSGFHSTIRIAIITEMVSRQIYSLSTRTTIRENRQAEETRLRIWRELQEYHRMLDASPLKLDMSTSAPVTITNMVVSYYQFYILAGILANCISSKWMWCMTILLHRPFISYSQELSKPNDHASNSSSDSLEGVGPGCNICSILEKYAENLAAMSCDLIFPIFTTASILAHYSKQMVQKGLEQRAHRFMHTMAVNSW